MGPNPKILALPVASSENPIEITMSADAPDDPRPDIGRTGQITSQKFNSAALKVNWAEHHVKHIENLLQAVHSANLQTVFAMDDPEPDRVQLAINFTPLLRHVPAIQMMTGDTVHNLRSALDHIAWAIVSAFREPHPRLYFPIHADLNSLLESRDFKEIKSICPEIADLIVNEIKPFGSDNPLVKLSILDNTDKHRVLLVHMAMGQCHVYMAKDDDDVPETASDSFILICNPTRIPRPGSAAAIHNENYRGTAFDIRFDAALPFGNEPVIPTLRRLAQDVTRVIRILDSYCDKNTLPPGP
jgi:hypothetical protein